jgi:phosphopantothenoylcysteine synthetase/decarboxylase
MNPKKENKPLNQKSKIIKKKAKKEGFKVLDYKPAKQDRVISINMKKEIKKLSILYGLPTIRKSSNKSIKIVAGGTVEHIASHLSLSSIAYGTVGKQLFSFCCDEDAANKMDVHLLLTKMADHRSNIETVEDLSKLIDDFVKDKKVKIVFWAPAVLDFKIKEFFPNKEGRSIAHKRGKYSPRFDSDTIIEMKLGYNYEKLLHKIRETRKDIFLVSFKQTCGASEEEMYVKV